MKEIILVKYGEIILKGGNRAKFERVLISNIKNAIRNIDEAEIVLAQATLYITPKDPANTDLLVERLGKIFGIVSITRAAVAEKEITAIEETAKEYLSDVLTDGVKFKVEAKRSDKKFPLNSVQLSMEVGGYLHDAYPGLLVDVHNPEITVKVEIRDFGAYIYCNEKKLKGQGGMPIGSSLKATLLLSGGFDSPVAGHMIAKRGVEIDAVHFFSYPYTGDRAKEKVIELASIIAQ